MADGSGNDYEQQLDTLYAAFKAGSIDEHTTRVKSARLLLNQMDMHTVAHLTTSMLAASDDAHDQMTAAVLTVLLAQIVRLEDDVERLRIEVAKERTRHTDESKFVDEYGLGGGSGGVSVGGNVGGSDNTEGERSGE
jgi:hypothetical protein